MNPRDMTREQFDEYLKKIRNCLPFADERSGLKESQDAIDEAARRLREKPPKYDGVDPYVLLDRMRDMGMNAEVEAAIKSVKLRTANEQKERGNG